VKGPTADANVLRYWMKRLLPLQSHRRTGWRRQPIPYGEDAQSLMARTPALRFIMQTVRVLG